MEYRQLRAIISGGGTGGHIFPAISIADKLTELNPDTEILFVGADGKWTLEEGDFLLKVGNQQIGTACTKTKVWDTPNI